MSARVFKRAAAAQTGDLARFQRLGQAVEQFRKNEPTKPNIKQALALLDELTTLMAALVEQARGIRGQMAAVQLGLAATTAYCRAKTLASGRENGDRR